MAISLDLIEQARKKMKTQQAYEALQSVVGKVTPAKAELPEATTPPKTAPLGTAGMGEFKKLDEASKHKAQSKGMTFARRPEEVVPVPSVETGTIKDWAGRMLDYGAAGLSSAAKGVARIDETLDRMGSKMELPGTKLLKELTGLDKIDEKIAQAKKGTTEYFQRQEQAYLKKASEGATPVQEFVGGGVHTAAAMLPQIILAVITGGASVPASGIAHTTPSIIPGLTQGSVSEFFGKLLNMTPFMAQASGNYMIEAKEKHPDASEEQITAYGLVGGLSEGLTEMFSFGALEKALGIGEHAVKRTAKKGIGNILKDVGKKGLEWLVNAGAQVVQEAAVEPMAGAAEKAILDSEMPVVGEGGIIDFSQMTEAAKGALAMSLVMTAMGLPANMASYALAKKYVGKEMNEKDIQKLYDAVNKDLEKIANKTAQQEATAEEAKPVEPVPLEKTETAKERPTEERINTLKKLRVGMSPGSAEYNAISKRIAELEAEAREAKPAPDTKEEVAAAKAAPTPAEETGTATSQPPFYKVGDKVTLKDGNETRTITVVEIGKSTVKGVTDKGAQIQYGRKSFERIMAEQKPVSAPDDASKVITPKPAESAEIATPEKDIKAKQFETISKTKPAPDDTHTWIRSADEIKTYQEAIREADIEGQFAPDYTGDMAKTALDTGKITVYSSNPIEPGAFVTPSRMEAQSYAGKGKIYSKEVALNDVAWIDAIEGQYAPAETAPEKKVKAAQEGVEPWRLTKEEMQSSQPKVSGMEIKYNSGLKNEASNKTTHIEVGDKFFDLSEQQRKNIIIHEINHNIASDYLYSQKNYEEVVDGGAIGTIKTTDDGRKYFDGIFGETKVDEAFTEALTVYDNNPDELLKRYPDAYDLIKKVKSEYTTSTKAEIEAIEKEFFGSKMIKVNLQLFAEKRLTAYEKLRDEFRKEVEAIKYLEKEKRADALERLKQKYEAKIERFKKLLDAEKYKNFWKSELDKREFKQKLDTLRDNKNRQIAAMQKRFSEKLKDVRRQYTLKKHEAISKLKEKYRTKEERARARTEERDEINKKLTRLRKIDLKHMLPEYRKQIEAIFENFDISAKKHTAKKLNELQRIKQYIESNPEHNIPDHILKRLSILSKKTVSQITKAEFDDIYNSVMHLVHLEKLKNKLIMKGRYREAAEIAQRAAENVLKNRKIKTDPTSIDTNKPEFSQNYVKEFYLNHLNPETLCVMSDQSSDGIIKNVLFDNMYEGHSNELKYRQDAYKIFEEFLGSLGGDIRTWSRSLNRKIKNRDLVEIKLAKQPGQTVSKIRITKAERLYLYLASKDADAKRSILKGGASFGTNLSQVVKMTEADLSAIAESLSDRERQFADLVEKYFLDYARPLMNEVFLELNGYELIPTRKGYVPIKRHGDFLNRDYLKMRNKPAQVSLEGMGVLKERVHASSPIVVDDIFRALVEHVEKVSAYYGLAKPLRNAKMLMANPKFKNAFRQTGMYNVYQHLSKYLQDAEMQSVDMEFFDKIAYSIQHRFASSALGLNPFTILKQFSAYVLETNEINPKYLLKAQFTKSAIDEIYKYSPILLDRLEGNASLEIGEIRKIARIRKLFGNYKDLPDIFTRGIAAADRQIIAKTWNAVKMMIREQYPAISEEELLTQTARKTEEIVRHTNSASTLYDRSPIGRSKSLFMRSLTMFTSQTNIMFNSAVRAILEYNQSQKTAKDFVKASGKLITILVLANLAEQSVDKLRRKITRKDDDEERWNIPLDILEGILSQIYFVGKAFSAYKSKLEYGKLFGYDFTVPQLQIAEQVINYATDLTTLVEQIATKEKYKSGKNKGQLKWKKTLQGLANETFSILSKFLGLPYDSVKRIIEGTKEKAEDWYKENIKKSS